MAGDDSKQELKLDFDEKLEQKPDDLSMLGYSMEAQALANVRERRKLRT